MFMGFSCKLLKTWYDAHRDRVSIPPSPPELPWSRLHRDFGCGLRRPQSASSSNPTLSYIFCSMDLSFGCFARRIFPKPMAAPQHLHDIGPRLDVPHGSCSTSALGLVRKPF